MLVTGVDEELGQLWPDCLYQFPRGVDVTFDREERILVHAVDLDWDLVGPRTEGPFAGDRDAGLVEQRAARARPGLGESLRRGCAEREAGVHKVRGQVRNGAVGARAEFLVADAGGERDAVVDGRRPRAIEQVRRVDAMPAGPQAVGELAYSVGESLHVMEQDDLGHLYTPVIRRR